MSKRNEPLEALRAMMRAPKQAQKIPAPVIEAILASVAPQGVRPAVFDASADRRSVFNQAAHVESTPYDGPKLTPARARARWRKLYAACPCRLCALALNPPQTFAEGKAFGYEQPDAWPPTHSLGAAGFVTESGKTKNPIRVDNWADELAAIVARRVNP